ncbi:hypothetical protein VFPBJ_10350 [Purpureocillium lilacinum]|uniref:Uncharacterized protein n=1 Tax=Purpureocillium lilacinum TaxID=33203 RepID=A0A179G2G0_PURLI|nr:hypothetical protein VFPBJ_10350 [Purpureocillium lilacinum]
MAIASSSILSSTRSWLGLDWSMRKNDPCPAVSSAVPRRQKAERPACDRAHTTQTSYDPRCTTARHSTRCCVMQGTSNIHHMHSAVQSNMRPRCHPNPAALKPTSRAAVTQCAHPNLVSDPRPMKPLRTVQ